MIGLGAIRARLVRVLRSAWKSSVFVSKRDTIDTIDTFDTRGALAAALVLLASSGCNGLLDIHDLPVAADTGSEATSVDGDDGDVGAPDTCGASDDPHDCGACGHDCLGGACTAGVCQPIQISNQETFPNSLAVDPEDDGGVYVANWDVGGVLARMQKDGSKRKILHRAEGTFHLNDVVVDSARAYWVSTHAGTVAVPPNLDQLYQANKIDGRDLVSLGPWDWSWRVAVDASDVFLLNRQETELLVRAPIGLGSKTTIDHVATRGPVRYSLAIQQAPDGKVFFSGSDGIVSMNKDGTGRQVLYGPEVVNLALDDRRIWFTVHDTISWIGIDGTCPGESACPAVFVRGQSDAVSSNLAVDATRVYWTWPKGGVVLRVRKSDATVETVAAVADVRAVALDPRAVYYSARTSIYKVAK